MVPDARPASRIWQWALAIAAASALLAFFAVGYRIVRPGDYGVIWSDIAYYALMFPVFALVWALLAVIASCIAWWSGARLAGAGFALNAILSLVLATAPALGVWRLVGQQTVAVSLASHFALETHPQIDPAKTRLDVVYGTATDGTALLLDIWRATGAVKGVLRPAFVRVHGGAWIYGVKSGLPAWNAWLNELGYDVFDVDYRMPPPPRWKDEVGDVKCALGWVNANAETFGIDRARISVMGYSAGGNLAMLAAYSMGSPDLPPSCAAAPFPIKSVVNLYGPADLTRFHDTSPSPDYVRDALRHYVGGPVAEFPDRYKAISPLTYIGPFSPPTITILGLSDRIVPREQADELDRALDAAGVTHETDLLPWADHGFDANWGSLGAQFSRARIKAFIEKNG